jgi:transcriptional regulator with GAF, ATPase, and Fis domain
VKHKGFAGNIIGDSGIIKQVKARIRKIAKFPWPVLIIGESGVGKELAARAVHDLSPRREKPFVPVNCAGLPDTLAESELFGYEKGAFTGADICKNGKFREACNGTVFLDEIGEASIKFQLTLLRVLENRVGSPAQVVMSNSFIKFIFFVHPFFFKIRLPQPDSYGIRREYFLLTFFIMEVRYVLSGLRF